MGRLRANFARLGNPMQDCHLRKEPCVTFYAVRPLGWNSMVRGDFGASLRYARNDSSARAIALYITPSGGRGLRIAAEPSVQSSGPTGRLISDSLSADCIHSSNLNSQISILKSTYYSLISFPTWGSTIFFFVYSQRISDPSAVCSFLFRIWERWTPCSFQAFPPV